MLALETEIPYNDARYYPVYAKCAELGVPVGLNVGVPGPQVPAKHQHPLTVDEVCCFFPELTVVIQHGGEPWEGLCVKMMVKYPRLYYMTSAFTPKRIPKAILDYANTRGADRMMYRKRLSVARRCHGAWRRRSAFRSVTRSVSIVSSLATRTACSSLSSSAGSPSWQCRTSYRSTWFNGAWSESCFDGKGRDMAVSVAVDVVSREGCPSWRPTCACAMARSSRWQGPRTCR